MNDAHLDLWSSEEWREALEKWIIPYALDGADLGDDVLEIGPGPGMTTDLLRAGLAKLTSVELDDKLAGSLATRLRGTNVEVVRADATNMPFGDGRFTGAVSFTMLHHVPTADLQDHLLSEAARVLTPGGVLVISDSIASPELEALHVGDSYNPVDPAGIESRLRAAGFVTSNVRANEFGWAAHAVR
jgi:SAM-dependent methyltransferase